MHWHCSLYDKSIVSISNFFIIFSYGGMKQKRKYNSLLPRAQPNSKQEEIQKEHHFKTFVHLEDFLRPKKPTSSTFEHHVVDDPIEETFEGSLIKEHIEDPPHITLT